MKQNRLKIAFKHLKTVLTHKRWVYHYCRLCGITWRGIKHDMSKFSPTEFGESIKYYTGTRSPIDVCKEQNGVSFAWMHHKGRNDHHYEYWQDNFDKGGNPVDMPFDCVIEMLCDYLGAGRAYNGKSFTYLQEFQWFLNKLNKNTPAMHIHSKVFIYECLEMLASIEQRNIDLTIKDILNKPNLFSIYVNCSEFTEETFRNMRKNVESGWNLNA